MSFNLELNADILDVKLKPSGEVEFKLLAPMTADLWMFLGRNSGQTVNLGMSSSQLEFSVITEKPESTGVSYQVEKIGSAMTPATEAMISERREEILNASAPPAVEKVRKPRKSKTEEKIEEVIKESKPANFDEELEELANLTQPDPNEISEEDLAELFPE